MSIKNELMKIRNYDRMIGRKLAEQERLREMVLSITVAWKSDVVQSSGSQDKLGDAVAKIVDLDTEINSDVDALVDVKRAMMKKIDSLEFPLADVLYKRYFDYDRNEYKLKTWEQIAVELGYSYRQIVRFHGEALQKIEKF